MTETETETEIKWRDTKRGFRIGEFNDSHGRLCSVQKSSSAGINAIWLGCTTLDYRMIIERGRAGELAEVLQHFADTGELP